MPDGGGASSGMDVTEQQMVQQIVPSAETARDFRNALGRFATGVTVITTQSQIGPLGITANSFASVSLDPALILWSPAKQSMRYDAFASCDHFAVHVIGAEQRGLCERFIREGTAFEGADWGLNADEIPVLNGCLARFECRRHVTHDGGDHGIVVGQVLRASWRDGEPLLFSQGGFGAFKTHS